MKNKLMFLIGEGLKRKINTKTFKIVNIILILAIPILINIDSIIKMFGGDFEESTKIYIVDDTNSLYESFANIYEETETISLSQTEVELIKAEKTREELENEIKDEGSKNIILDIQTDTENIINAELISYEDIDQLLEQKISNALNTLRMNIAIQESSISIEELENIYKSVEINNVI